MPRTPRTIMSRATVPPDFVQIGQSHCTSSSFLYETCTVQNQAVGMASAIDYVGDKVYITTERLLLRPAKEEDVGELHEVFHDPTVMLYWYIFPIEKESCLSTWLGASFRTTG
jgi:RimJ/RimL family protein N-acetyltransferase